MSSDLSQGPVQDTTSGAVIADETANLAQKRRPGLRDVMCLTNEEECPNQEE